MQSIILFIIGIFDYFHKKRIINFLKKKVNLKQIDVLLDVGAHKGESINLLANNFDIKKIISFEASPKNFFYLKSKKKYFKKKFPETEIIMENIALGSKNKRYMIKEFVESSSSTIQNINKNSKYYIRKYKWLNLFGKRKIFDETEINITKFSDYLNKNEICKIDFLKIDTEGYEYEIIKGLSSKIKNIKIIYFEHHYDLMIEKNYTFSDIHRDLQKYSFKKIYKSKMPFRKTFEYIYEKN